jgi:hypothetical protein
MCASAACRNTTLSNNSATSAAGLAAFGNAFVDCNNCMLEHNIVLGSGAGMVIAQSAQVLWCKCSWDDVITNLHLCLVQLQQ